MANAAVLEHPDLQAQAARVIPFVIGLGPFVSYLDNTLVNAVFPSILAEFGQDVATTSWVINGGNLALITGLVIAGTLADAQGRRRMYLFGLFGSAVFAAASAVAPGLPWLVLSRMGLGLAGALLLASSLALIASAVRPERQAAAVGLYAAIGGLGSLVGPMVGAASTGMLSWRWGFAAIVPISLAGAALSLRWLPSDHSLGGIRVNLPACVLAGLCVAGVLFTLSNGPTMGWSSTPILASFGGATVLGIVVLVGEARSARPMFPGALRTRHYVQTLVGIFGMGFVLGVVLFAIPLFVTQVQGASFSSGSIALAPAALIGAVAAILSGKLAARFGYGVPSMIGLTLGSLALVALTFLGPGSGAAAVMAVSGFAGIGIGMGIPAMAGGVLVAAPKSHAGAGSGWYHSARVLGIALGVVTFVTLFSQNVDGTMARRWTTAALAEASTGQGDLALRTFDRLLACDQMSCVNLELNDISAESADVAEILRDGIRRHFAERYHTAFRWCAGLVAASLAAWLALRTREPVPAA